MARCTIILLDYKGKKASICNCNIIHCKMHMDFRDIKKCESEPVECGISDCSAHHGSS